MRGLGAEVAATLSLHSGRVWLACALLAQKRSHAEIQALCRWVSEQSLHIYARLNEASYAYWVRKAMLAHVDSTRTTNLVAGIPQTDDDHVMQDLAALDLGAA